MKKYLLLSLVIIILICQLLNAGVRETKHNFASSTYSPNAYFLGAQQVCVFCHTAHNGDISTGALWNHNTQSNTYLMYDSPTMDMSRTAQPNKGSMVCLTCHDGTIAVNSLNNLPGPQDAGLYGTPGGSALDAGGKLTSVSSAYIGTDLRNDHPVGIIYDASLDLSGFSTKTGNPESYPDKLLSEGTYVECISCHNPHDNTYSNFLIESNDNSNLCLRCHIK